MRRKRSSASGGWAIATAANARATSVAAPSPTMRPMRSSLSGAAPHSTSSALVAFARSRRESTSVPSRSKTMSENAAVGAGGSGLAVTAIVGERRRRFPHRDADDGKTVLRRLVEDQFRDPLHGRVAVEEIDRLAEFLERLDERIVVTQQHLVIELAVDPAFDQPLDVAEIADH